MIEVGFRGDPEIAECCGVLAAQPCKRWCVNAKEAPVKYLRLTIDVSVYNDEVVVALEKLEMSNLDLVRNIEAGEIEIDGYSDVEVH